MWSRLLISVAVILSIISYAKGCTDKALRLANGTKPSEGRIEVCYKEKWDGIVCGWGLTVLGGRVICRQLGFPYDVIKFSTGEYGEKENSTIVLSNIQCTGEEETVYDCTLTDLASLGLGVVLTCPFDYEEYGVACLNSSAGVCTNYDVRLVDGSSPAQGRVEVCFNGEWGTVCNSQFNEEEGHVLCRQLGFLDVLSIPDDSTAFGQGNTETKIILQYLQCKGTEENIFDCVDPLNIGVSVCGHYQDAGIVCIKEPECTEGDIKLEGGKTEMEGRVTVCYNGRWGTVCDDDFAVPDARVVCRQLGLPNELVGIYGSEDQKYGPGMGLTLLDDVGCFGFENTIFSCSSLKGPFSHNCAPEEDVGITCGKATKDSCQEGLLRLTNGNENTEGTVEVCYNGQWGTICLEGFNQNAAKVVCRQLGFQHAMYVFSVDDTNNEAVLVSGLQCGGTEDDISHCSSTLNNGKNVICDDLYIAGVICLNTTDGCSDGDMRLAGNGRWAREGRLEVCLQKEWGSVCNKGFDYQDALVSCSQLGYTSDEAEIVFNSVSAFGEMEAYKNVWMSEVGCEGDEEDLLNCTHISTPSDCDHKDDVGVRCFNILQFNDPAEVTMLFDASNVTTEVTFTCGATETTDDSIEWEWLYKNLTLVHGNRYVIEISSESSTSSLTVIKMRATDMGRYSCLAKYTNSENSLNKTFHLELKNKLIVTAVPIIMASSYSATLSCDLSGYITDDISDKTIQWWIDGQIVNDDGTKYSISVSAGNSELVDNEGTLGPSIVSSLTIFNASINDSTGVVYQCSSSDMYMNISLEYIDDVVEEPTDPPTLISGALTTVIIAASIPSAIICVCLVFFLGCLIRIQRKKNRHRKTGYYAQMGPDAGQRMGDNAFNMTDLPSEHDYVDIKERRRASRKLSKALMTCLIDPTNLKLLEKIGQGEFGVVYRGTLMDYRKNSAKPVVTQVAIKTLKGFYSQSEIDELIKEADRMSDFDHLNVLSLMGVCLDLLKSPCLVMPFMSNGSLLSYLRKEAPNLVVASSASENIRLDTMKQLLSMCLQVAKGMAYLAERKFIHRDLASRNCMISAEGTIKVADFGLAEEMYTAEYFKQEQKSSDEAVKLPLKWMALESIHYGKFSEKSDVWSYGVLCWEVFNVGKTPYPGQNPNEVVALLDKGERLLKPLNAACTKDVFALMMSCWKDSPDMRPSFKELVDQINVLLVPLAEYMDFTFNN